MTPCSTPYCRRKASHGKLCSTCYTRKWRKVNPVRSAWLNLRNNAKRRGKPFTISFKYFIRFCYRTDYIGRKGRGESGYSIDCKKNKLGYVPGNLALLTVPQNAHKGKRPVKKLEYDWMLRTGRYMKYLTMETITKDEDLPF